MDTIGLLFVTFAVDSWDLCDLVRCHFYATVVDKLQAREEVVQVGWGGLRWSEMGLNGVGGQVCGWGQQQMNMPVWWSTWTAATTLEIVLRAVPTRDIRQKRRNTSSGDIHHVIRVKHQCQRLECAYSKCVLLVVCSSSCSSACLYSRFLPIHTRIHNPAGKWCWELLRKFPAQMPK